jgi:hypothetical protein
MEMQQMMQQLVANQEKAEANRKADGEALKVMMDANQQRVNVQLAEMKSQ